MIAHEAEQQVGLGRPAVQLHRDPLPYAEQVEERVHETKVAAPCKSPGAINAVEFVFFHLERDIKFLPILVHFEGDVRTRDVSDEIAPVQPREAFVQTGRVEYVPFLRAQFATEKLVGNFSVPFEPYAPDHRRLSRAHPVRRAHGPRTFVKKLLEPDVRHGVARVSEFPADCRLDRFERRQVVTARHANLARKVGEPAPTQACRRSLQKRQPA